MSERKIRIGLVGYGNIGSMHAKNLCDHKIPRANLAAICDIDASKRQKAGECFPSIPLFSSLDDMLQHADIDALLIATPHNLHCEMAIAAFEHGLHVLTEKPICNDLRKHPAVKSFRLGVFGEGENGVTIAELK